MSGLLFVKREGTKGGIYGKPLFLCPVPDPKVVPVLDRSLLRQKDLGEHGVRVCRLCVQFLVPRRVLVSIRGSSGRLSYI